MTFSQMEKVAAIIDLIQQHETLIDQVDSGIKTSKIDAIPGGSNPDPHRIEQLLIRKENALAKLPQLRRVRDGYMPHVRKTIEEATAKCKPSARIRAQMVFRLRYEQGLSWQEIQHITGINLPKDLVWKYLEVQHGS